MVGLWVEPLKRCLRRAWQKLSKFPIRGSGSLEAEAPAAYCVPAMVLKLVVNN